MKRFKILFLVDVLIILAISLVSCGKNAEEHQEAEAEQLYHQTCQIAKAYIDSIRNAPDSTSLYSLMDRFDERLTDINFSKTADTDLHLTEGANDTIDILLTQIRKAYDARLDSLALRHDTNIPQDSI